MEEVYFWAKYKDEKIETNSVLEDKIENLTMESSMLEGYLEIDSKRGVIYFHGKDGITLLRICHLPKSIPNPSKSGMLDITHMYGCNWKEEEKKEEKNARR
jgi:hypothetical protein